jgi:serine/threonine-protein kinase
MSDAPLRLKTALAGRYEIERELGQGGMATVFLARDVRHHRLVAVKLLSPELGAVLGGERFLSEIRVTANLQHPNILPLFDSGEADGLLFYVMPFVDGESLRARLDREKQLPVDEALRIATAVAGALEYAHSRGVIHRDLKPENILLQSGQPIVADFGIALAVSNAGGARVTQTGISLGTPQYMSPEQATGDRAIDGRSDIYSLSAVLYEMLSGDPPHVAGTAQAIIAKVLSERPADVRRARPSVPEHVAIAIDRGLEKLAADRWAHAADFAAALAGALESGDARTRAAASRFGGADARRARRVWWIAGASLAVALIAIALAIAQWRSARASAPQRPLRFALDLPPAAGIAGVTGPQAILSPDGMVLVARVRTATEAMLYARRMDKLAFTPIAGTQGARAMVVSPDGNWIAFNVDSSIKKVPIGGGAPTVITPVNENTVAGLAWVGDEIIIGAAGTVFGLRAVAASGGAPRVLTTIESARASAQTRHRWPRGLADGQTVLFTEWGDDGVASARIGLTSRSRSAVTILNVDGVYALGMIGERLIYAHADGTIMAVGLDLRRRLVVGEPVALEAGASVRIESGAAQADLSQSGTLIFSALSDASRLVLVDSIGGSSETLRDTPHDLSAPRFSPDGKRIAMVVGAFPHSEIWIEDIAAKTQTRLAESKAYWNLHPEWFPDGKRIAFSTSRTTPPSLWWAVADGSTPAEPLAERNEPINEAQFTPDGKQVVFRLGLAPWRLAFRAVTGDTTIHELVVSPYIKQQPALSPDGRWIAYASFETGESRIYVRSFPGPPSKWPVSDGLGVEPVWSADGRTIYYRGVGQMIAARVQTTPTFAVKSREVLFADGYRRGGNHRDYDRHGRKFAMVATINSAHSLTVVANWGADVAERLKGK